MKKIFKLFRVKSYSKRIIKLLTFKEHPLEFVGLNWDKTEKLPVALLFGFNPWKREVLSAFFSDYRTAFVKGKVTFHMYLRVYKHFIKKMPADQNYVFVVWGNKSSFWLDLIAKHKKIPIYTIEDGFLRSVGPGLLHGRPSSLCLDSKGIYFNAEKPSKLESIIQNFDKYKNDELIQRAKQAIQLYNDARLSKYYDTEPFNDVGLARTNNYSILVMGQVEDDASILKGRASVKSSLGLVQQAKKDYPEADIYFRPHPDHWLGNRKGKWRSSLTKISQIAAVVPPESSIHELFDMVDHVYTITSLTGFEALLRGLKVTVLGAPFYSGWGLTDDRVKVSRRTRKASLEELFAAVYFLYPTYMHNNSNERTTFEETAGYFIVDVLKDKNLFELKDESLLFKNTLPHKDSLSVPFKLLSYLSSTGNFSCADSEEVKGIIESNFKLADFTQNSHLLYVSSNYDALVSYCNYSIDYLESEIDVLIEDPFLLENFFYSLSIAQMNANGRVVKVIPNINELLLEKLARESNFHRLLVSYLVCLASGLQYDVLEDMLEKLYAKLDKDIVPFEIHWTLEEIIQNTRSRSVNVGTFKAFTSVLLRKSYRSERNSDARHSLLMSSANSYLDLLNKRHNSSTDILINKILFWLLLEDSTQIVISFDSLLTFLETKGDNLFDNALQQRNKDFYAIAHYCIKKGIWDVADKIVKSVPNDFNSEATVFLKLVYLKEKYDNERFLVYYDKLSKNIKNSEKIMVLYARYLKEYGFFERAKDTYTLAYQRARTVAKKNSLKAEIQKIDFCRETSSILNSVPQPTIPKGVVILASQTCLNTLAMMAPSLVELKKKGYAVINLMAGMTDFTPTGISYIDKFQGIIPLRMSFHQLNHEWRVDWEKREVVAGKINFYQGFYERLSTWCRRYHVDINMPIVNKEFRLSLARADTCLTICQDIYTEIVQRGIPVALISGNSHVTPFSIFRDFARSKDHPLLNFVNCNVAYESYFSNLGSKFANTMCVTDMTLYPNIRAPFMARKDRFNRWYEKNKDDTIYLEKSRALINVNRVGSTTNTKEQEIIGQLEAYKKAGKKIICAFGKVPVDLNVPYDGGPAHTDMADWLNHTVQICGNTSDIILLVKPHPHELRPEIALDLVESFHDLITVPVKDNVFLLGHRDINGHALAPYLDLALLYNGSSGLELTAQGIPVMMTAYFGRYDYPVELNYPIDRGQYEDFILSLQYPVPDEELRKKAAFLMCYLGTDEISILNQYSLRQLTNDRVGPPKWRKDKIRRFLKEGDPKMRLVADQIVEKFE